MKNAILIIMFILLGNLFAQEIDRKYYLDNIDDDFIGVYLPVEYIKALKETKNHSIAMHRNNKRQYHDILIVYKNIIRSNSKFHDSYAVEADEGKLYRFTRNGNERTIIDNNGYSYSRISNDPSQANSTTDIYIMKIVFESLLKQGNGVSIINDKIKLPFLYFFTGEDTFTVVLDDLFWEEGGSLLLRGRGNRQFYFTLFMITDGVDYTFYEEKEGRGPYSYKEDTPFFRYSINGDREILVAAAGLSETVDSELQHYLNGLTEYGKRKIINAMFALNGYSFATKEWQDYFAQYSWYRPRREVRNDRAILNIRQQRLLDYLNGA
jgi:hypothetical protein